MASFLVAAVTAARLAACLRPIPELSVEELEDLERHPRPPAKRKKKAAKSKRDRGGKPRDELGRFTLVKKSKK